MTMVKLRQEGRVGILQLDRPDALNALNMQVLDELSLAMEAFEADQSVGAIVILGSDKAFSAGADIKESQDRSFPDVYLENWQAGWSRISNIRLPIIAAVKEYALGGGCELAMICDIIIAGENARFGQPEIKLGVIPGMGGTQRLTRSVGKAKAADLLLTARTMDATEAERAGLVSRIMPSDEVDEAAIDAAQTIAGFGRATGMLLKASLNKSFETSLAEGLSYGKLAFHACFATQEQTEGMAAFAEKRAAQFHQERTKS